MNKQIINYFFFMKSFVIRYWGFILVAFISAILLIFTSNPILSYEQDQPSKAAQILLLSKTNLFFDIKNSINLYQSIDFTFYYLISALLYKLFGGNIITFMNLQAVISGLVLIISVCIILQQRFKINPLISGLVFLSMPNVIILFTYGNEFNYSFLLFCLSLLFIESNIKNRLIFASLFFSFSFYSRPEILLLFPFWLGWIITKEKYDQKQIIILIIQETALLSIFIVLYWAIFLRTDPMEKINQFFLFPLQLLKLGKGSSAYTINANFKLVLAILSYPFNLSVIILGFGGLLLLLKDRKHEFIILFSLLIPVAFYFQHIVSPKHIIALVLFFGIPAAFFVSRLNWGFRILSIAGILFWWFFSISPYAIAGLSNGQYYIIPTADGAYPTGSYLKFYEFIHNGFYQQKYYEESEASILAAKTILNSHENTLVINNGNESFFVLAIAELDIKQLDQWQNYSRSPIEEFDNKSKLLMLSRDYLFSNRMQKSLREQFLKWLQKGQVLNLEPNKVFPDVIEIGDSVSVGHDYDLGKRIQFADSYYQYGIVQSDYDPIIYKPTYWLSTSKAQKINIEPIYCDNQFCAFNTKIADSDLYILELPVMYLKEQDINKK